MPTKTCLFMNSAAAKQARVRNAKGVHQVCSTPSHARAHTHTTPTTLRLPRAQASPASPATQDAITMQNHAWFLRWELATGKGASCDLARHPTASTKLNRLASVSNVIRSCPPPKLTEEPPFATQANLAHTQFSVAPSNHPILTPILLAESPHTLPIETAEYRGRPQS